MTTLRSAASHLRVLASLSALLLLAGCASIKSSYETLDNQLDADTRLTASYRGVVWAPTSLIDRASQYMLYNMIREMLADVEALDSEEGGYLLVFEVLELDKISNVARRNTGMFAGTDLVRTRITVVEIASIDDEEYDALLDRARRTQKFDDPDPGTARFVEDMADRAEALLELEAAHVFEAIVETRHHTPDFVDSTRFLGKHASDLVVFLLDEKQGR